MKKPSRDFFLHIFTGILFTCFFITLSVILVLNFKPLYYVTAWALDLEGTYGLSLAQVYGNYYHLIRYNSPFYFNLLEFPDLPSSREALIHFVEVKIIFMEVYLLALASGSTLWFLLPRLKRKGILAESLKISSIIMVLLPTLVGGAIALNFDRAFVLFHEIFFRNDFWLFDPDTDPIIMLLPDTFFLVCAAAIVILVLLATLSLAVISRRMKKGEANPLENTENFL